jgi:hypothetical protein
MTYRPSVAAAIVAGALLGGMVLHGALAEAPADLAKLVGAGAKGAESAMEVLGYKATGKNDGTWFNASTGTCVKLHVTGDKLSSIDTLDAAACGG